MSIVQLNIRTRIELETRVLAAALKQSFERGDADGVSLAHRQLFLLLKDQKPGNGSGTASTPKSIANPTSGNVSVDTTPPVETEHQPVYVPAAYAEPEFPTAALPHQPPLTESEEVGEEEVDEDDDPEQAHAIAQYLRYKQTRDQIPGDPQEEEEEEQPEGVSATEPAGEIETHAEQNQPSTLTQQAVQSEEEDYVRMRKVEAPPKADLPFDQPSAEYAEIYGSVPIEPVDTLPTTPGIQFANPNFGVTAAQIPGPFDAVPEAPPQFAQRQFISSTPPTEYLSEPASAEPGSAAIPISEPVSADIPSDFEPRSADIPADVQPGSGEISAGFEPVQENIAPDYAEADQAGAHYVAAEYATPDQPQMQHQELEDSATDQVSTQHPESEFAPLDQSSIQHPEPEQATADQPGAELDYTAAEQPLAQEQESQYAASDQSATNQLELVSEETDQPVVPHFESETITSDQPILPAPDAAQQSETEQAATGADAGFAQEQTPAEVDPAAHYAQQNSAQDLPQIDYTLQSEVQNNQQAPDYSAKYASQSSPRNMPAIDFSLESESNKPMIDFSLESESNRPSIDFSLQSESNHPLIDFSLQSESQTQPILGDALNAPTSSGFIEAEFVNRDSDSDADSASDEAYRQDITAELPIVNPDSALHLSEEEAAAYQEEQVAAQTFDPPAEVPAIALPALVAPMHTASVAVNEAGMTPRAATSDMDTTAEEVPIPPVVPKPPDLYALLGVSQMSPFEEIHKNFLRKIRKILLKLRSSVRPERDELLKELRRNWVARDILCDPVTRTDYDFRDMGLRGSPDGQLLPHAPEDGPQGRLGQRTPLRIGELLQCAGLLEMAELEIACDMHKAMPEMQFGTFLVRQGFIQERDLDSVLLGQNLLRDGKITVAQFQVAMELSQSRGANISDTLIDHGYITAAELTKLTGKSTAAESNDTPTIKEVAVKPRQQEQAPSNVSASSAVPTWKDQLDWSKPLPVDDDASLVDRNPEKQSLAELLGNVNTEVAADQIEKDSVKISNNAAPSWKDQLDWEQPQEATASATSEHETAQTSEDNTAHAEHQQQQEEPQNSINLASAVPSWKDQLDWEQPKAESKETANEIPGHAEAHHADEEGFEDNADEDDEPLIHSSKETQPISIHPPTSVAPNVTLGKGNLGTIPNADQEMGNEEDYLQDLLKSTDIFEPEPINTGDSSSQEKTEDDETTDKSEEESEHPPDEQEGFFKKSFGKFKRPDAKDKDKKKKRK